MDQSLDKSLRAIDRGRIVRIGIIYMVYGIPGLALTFISTGYTLLSFHNVGWLKIFMIVVTLGHIAALGVVLALAAKTYHRHLSEGQFFGRSVTGMLLLLFLDLFLFSVPGYYLFQ